MPATSTTATTPGATGRHLPASGSRRWNQTTITQRIAAYSASTAAAENATTGRDGSVGNAVSIERVWLTS